MFYFLMEQPYCCFFTTREQRFNIALSYKQNNNLYCVPFLAVCVLRLIEIALHTRHIGTLLHEFSAITYISKISARFILPWSGTAVLQPTGAGAKITNPKFPMSPYIT